MVAAALVVVGVLFGVSAGSAESNEPRADKARSALLDDIDRAEQRQSELAGSATELADQLRATQSALGAAGPLQTVSELENAGQITPVTGPGLRIVLDNAPATGAAVGSSGVILDRDVQLLVNDLWAAGGEAISIGGVRLQPRSCDPPGRRVDPGRQPPGVLADHHRGDRRPVGNAGEPGRLAGVRQVLLLRSAVRHRIRRLGAAGPAAAGWFRG